MLTCSSLWRRRNARRWLLAVSLIVLFAIIYVRQPEEDLLTPTSNYETPGIVPPILKAPEDNLRLHMLEDTFVDFTNNHHAFWESLTEEKLSEESNKLKTFLKSLYPSSFPSDFKGRGVVYASKSASSTITSIKFLRHYGCTLPVEVWHYKELSSDDIARLESNKDVTVKDFSKVLTDIKFVRQQDERMFLAKGAALYFSSFKEVLLLDSDNYPCADPTFLFETKYFRAKGAIFWYFAN
jgi:Mannosyltransferase putative